MDWGSWPWCWCTGSLVANREPSLHVSACKHQGRRSGARPKVARGPTQRQPRLRPKPPNPCVPTPMHPPTPTHAHTRTRPHLHPHTPMPAHAGLQTHPPTQTRSHMRTRTPPPPLPLGAPSLTRAPPRFTAALEVGCGVGGSHLRRRRARRAAPVALTRTSQGHNALVRPPNRARACVGLICSQGGGGAARLHPVRKARGAERRMT
jgi:hypothetical protein